MPGLNFSRRPDCTLTVLWLSYVIAVPRLGRESFFPVSFQFVIHQYHHSVLHNQDTNGVVKPPINYFVRESSCTCF